MSGGQIIALLLFAWVTDEILSEITGFPPTWKWILEG